MEESVGNKEKGEESIFMTCCLSFASRVSLVVLVMLGLRAKLAHLVPQEKMDDRALLVHKVPVGESVPGEKGLPMPWSTSSKVFLVKMVKQEQVGHLDLQPAMRGEHSAPGPSDSSQQNRDACRIKAYWWPLVRLHLPTWEP
uniref:Uncharacterized protein n=1 Tax=Sphaerodactylus townsendi TaxID=933632 RepID=A0ACB8ENF4_9SAUR